MSDRDEVTFKIPPGIPDVPAGEHPGYIDWTGASAGGGRISRAMRCVVRLKRADQPALYRELDISQYVLQGGIKFDFKM
jgi:hypothetical protein